MAKHVKAKRTAAAEASSSFVSGPLRAVAILGSIAAIVGYLSTISNALVPSISGCWDVFDTIVPKTPDKQPLELRFRISIAQTGRHFTAMGEKTHLNNAYLPASAHTVIEIPRDEGLVGLTEASGAFTEHGTARDTHGSFRWKIERESLFSLKAARLVGEFASGAANSTGSSKAQRCSS
jgi:hypothetical protein